MEIEILRSPVEFLHHMLGPLPHERALRDYESWWESEGKLISDATDRAGTPWLRMFDRRGKRVDEVCERTGIADVKNTIIGKLSKGYRQRVGIAQAIIHNPPVLILDEPTSGLDPHQQREARQLIASLSGDHTIILSTHILSEVEQSCSKVIIINNGEIVAVDSVANLHNRKRATETVAIEVFGAPESDIRSRLEQVPGVAHVITRDGRTGMLAFEVESLENTLIRPELARAIVQSGWQLNELRSVGESLEEIFLELTKSESTSVGASA